MSDSAYALAGFRRMVDSDLQGATLTYDNITYPCALGTFAIQQVLTEGGFTPKLLGDVQLARADLPDGLEFKRGQFLTVTPKLGPVRNCQIEGYSDMGSIISLNLLDKDQDA